MYQPESVWLSASYRVLRTQRGSRCNDIAHGTRYGAGILGHQGQECICIMCINSMNKGP